MSKIVLLGALLFGAGLLFFWSIPESPVLIQSQESKTREDTPVFNRIRFISRPNQDIWMMNQSHHGANAGDAEWDRLAIVVDKTKSPKQARYLQLKSGPLEWDAQAERKAFRVSCFMCHSNGPRAVRPEANSNVAPLSWQQKAQIQAWNLKIKSYGRVLYDPLHDEEDTKLAVPFRVRGEMENDRLLTPTCVKCHRDEGWLARGYLTRQNAITVQFMVGKNHMPPLWFQLPKNEQQKLGEFLRGF